MTENQQLNELGFQLFVDLLEEIPREKKFGIKSGN